MSTFHPQRRRRIVVAVILGLLLVVLGAMSASAVGTALFDSIPVPYPGSFASLGYQATSTDEFGDHVGLIADGKKLNNVVIGLTNWSCENDFTWNGSAWTPVRAGTDACVTTANSSFQHPITLNIYEVDNSGANPDVGALLTTKTETFDIPFRPSYDATNCYTGSGKTGALSPADDVPFGGTWYDPVMDRCYHGYAFNLTYDFTADNVVLPDEVIVTVAYNTGTYGAAPIGSTGPYDSLNVSLNDQAPTIGTDVEQGYMFWDSSYPGYNDVLVRDSGWPYTLVMQINTPEECTTTCYVDGAAGSDVNGGTSMADAKKTIQAAVNAVDAGGQVIVAAGTYPESPNLNKSLTLESVDGRDVTFIELQPQPTAPTYLGSLYIDGADVTVDGFTIVGFDADCADFGVDGDQDDASTNILTSLNAEAVVIKNNRFQVGAKGACQTWDDAIGVATTYSAPADTLQSLLVEDNIFEPANTTAGRAFYVNPGTVAFTFRGNEVNGQFDIGSYTQAKDGLVENNNINGTGTSRGMGTWGYPDPTLYGATLFQGNTINDVVSGITIYGSENVTVTKNYFAGNGHAVWVDEDVAFDLSTIHINRNSIDGNDVGVENWYTTDVDATCNWWGAANGPGPVGPGSGDPVTTFVDFSPWLSSSDLDGLCLPPPAAGLYIAPNKNNGVVGGVPYMDEDIVVNVLGTNNWAMYFDGSDVGITKNLTDFTFTLDNCLLMTFNGNQNVPGVGLVKPQDLVKFCPTSAGTTTAGTFTMYFDGSDVGLHSAAEIIDAVEVLANGDLVISTKGSSNIPQPSPAAPVKGKKNDLLIFHGTQYGPTTMGTWDIYYPNVLVPGLKKENIISLYIENGQDKYVSFWDKYTNVGGVSGDANDILIIHPDNTVTKFWEGSDWGYTGRVHGLHIVPEP